MKKMLLLYLVSIISCQYVIKDIKVEPFNISYEKHEIYRQQYNFFTKTHENVATGEYEYFKIYDGEDLTIYVNNIFPIRYAPLQYKNTFKKNMEINSNEYSLSIIDNNNKKIEISKEEYLRAIQ